MRDVLQDPIDRALGGVVGQMQHPGGLVDGLTELKTVGNLFVCGVNQ
jgi:hypothetical protein